MTRGVPDLEFVQEIAEAEARQALAPLPRPMRGQPLTYAGEQEMVVVAGEPWSRAASNATVDHVEVIADTLGRKWRRKVLPELSLRDDFQMRPGRDESEAWMAAMDYIKSKGGGTLIVDGLYQVPGTAAFLPSFLTLRSPAFSARFGPEKNYESIFGIDGMGATGKFLTWDGSDHVENVRLLGVTFKNRERYFDGPHTRYLARWRIEECSFQSSCDIGIKGNPYYLRMINNFLGYEGTAHPTFQALNFEGTDQFPSNKVSFDGNHIYSGNGDVPVVYIGNARRLIIRGDNYEQNRGSKVLLLHNVRSAHIESAWFELNKSQYQIEITGANSNHFHFRDIEYVSHRDNVAFMANSTGHDLDITWENDDILILGRYQLAGGTTRDVRLTADSLDYDRAFARYEAPVPVLATINTTAVGFDPYAQFTAITGAVPYPYTIRTHGADGTLRLGTTSRLPAPAASSAPTLVAAFGSAPLTAVGAASVVARLSDRVIMRRTYNLTPATTGPGSYSVGNIPSGWTLLDVRLAYGTFEADGKPEATAYDGFVRIVNTSTTAHQLQADFILTPA